MKLVSLYQIQEDRQFDAEKAITEEYLESFKFTPVGQLEKIKTGFVKNKGYAEYLTKFSLNNEQYLMMTFCQQKKVPESYMVKLLTDAKKVEYLAETDKQPDKALVKEFKESSETEVLSTTHPKEPKESRIIIRLSDNMILVEGKGNQAESMLALLRKAIGSLPAIPYQTELPLSDLMDDMVSDMINDKFTLGNKVTVQDPEGLVHKFEKGSIYDTDSDRYVLDGCFVTSVDLEYDGAIAFSLKDTFTLEGIKIDKEIVEAEELDDQGTFLLTVDLVVQSVEDLIDRLKEEEE